MTEPKVPTTEGHAIPESKVATDPGTGGDVLVALMRDLEVEVAFGVISIHNLPLVEAVDRDLRFVPVRHEAAAINAADGYARASGRIGVAITSTGTGAGNAAGAMLEALTAQSRVLHVTGNVDSEFLGENRGVYHEVPRQLDMLKAVSGHALRVEKANHARRTLHEAVRLLETAPYRPVSVDWPIDLQYTADPHKQAKTRGRRTKPRAEAPKSAVAKALKAMREAERPVIWAGGGARRIGAALTELAETWGAAVMTGANGRGSVPEDHPLCIGNFAVDDNVEELLADADCLLTVGSHLRGNETKNFELALPATHIQVDLDPDALGRNYPVTVAIQAEAGTTVAGLLHGLGKARRKPRTDDDWADRVATAAQAARQHLSAEIGAYRDICASMRDRLPRTSPLVRDVTVPGSSWGNRLLAVYDPGANVFAAGGGIGQGLAMSIGASIARPDVTTLAMVGDGGLAVHLGELCTLADEQAPVVVVVFNDGGYGVLRNMQEAKESPPRAVDLHTPNFSLLAQSLGLRHHRATDGRTFDLAMASALGRGGPTIIEVDVPALRPEPTPFVPPVDVP